METEPSGGGGSGAGGSPSSTSSTTPGGCTVHTDCADGELCIFATGECRASCGFESCDSCGPGFVCNDCASSACPDCLDCRAACLPVEADQCDEDDACGAQEACDFQTKRCEPTCDNGACADPNMVCEDCATGSCCGCRDCVALCLPL